MGLTTCEGRVCGGGGGSAEPVLDARRNATRNGVVNASFVAGKAEDKIESVLRGLTSQQKARCLPPLLP